MTIFNVFLHLKRGKTISETKKDTRGRDFEAENLIVIAKRERNKSKK
jgi:hypothetical protein